MRGLLLSCECTLALVSLTPPMRSNAQAPYVMPDNVKAVNYRLSVSKDAAISVKSGGCEDRITSRFSTTAPN